MLILPGETRQNTILTLQSGRSLIGSFIDASKGKKVADGVSYLNDLSQVLKARCPSDEVATDLKVMEDAWKCVAAHVVQKAAEDFSKHVKAGNLKDVAFELCSQERFVAAKVRITTEQRASERQSADS
jgi:acyl-CoA oxidase